MKNYLNEMRPGDFVKGHYTKAIIGVGSIESHGPHMPAGTDNMIAHGLASSIAENFDDMLLVPPITYGVSEHHKQFAPTVFVSAETMIATLKDVFESLVYRGINHIIAVNGHDGNIAPINIAGRWLKMKHPEATVITSSWWANLETCVPKNTFGEWWNGHGAEAETAFGLAYFPELVDMSLATPCIPALKTVPSMEVLFNFHEMSTVGNDGHPEAATPEKAALIKSIAIEQAVNYVKYLDSINWDYQTK